jgi:hypothetical protein
MTRAIDLDNPRLCRNSDRRKGEKRMKTASFLQLATPSFACLAMSAAMVFACLSGSAGRTAEQPAPKVAQVEIEPKAVEALKSMGSQLRAFKAFALRSETTIDEILDNGQKIQFGGTVDYRVRPPTLSRSIDYFEPCPHRSILTS